MDTTLLLCHTACVTYLALWLTSGAWDNLRYPRVNEMFTAEVMDMARLRTDYPDAYAMVAHRRITNRTLQKAAFRLVLIWEIVSTFALWGAAILLGLTLIGVAPDVTFARSAAQIAVLMFTTTWAMFLVVGNHFCYWFGHEGAQNTHFQMTLWGMATLIFLSIP
ncbi:MAG: DUF2165 family protein [Pseudomonadota bacterium]